MENMIKAAPSDVNTLVNRKLQAIIIDDPCVDLDPAFCELKLPDIAAKSLYCKTLAIVQPCLETCGFCPPSSSTMPSPVVSSLPSSQPSVVPSVLASSQPSTQPPNDVECVVINYCTVGVPSSEACGLLEDETLLCCLRCNRGTTRCGGC